MSRPGVLVLLLIACSRVCAGVPDLGIGGSHEQALEQLSKVADTGYAEALARYDSALRERPFDVVLAVERCRFMAALMYDELGRYAAAEEDHNRCIEALTQQFPDHPEVVLYQLESGNLDNANARAEEILRGRAWSGWTQAQIGRLHERLAFAYDAESKGPLAKHHALQALARDAGAGTRLIAARWQIHDEERAAALATLTSPLDIPDPHAWQAAERLSLLAELDARDQAMELYAKLREQPDDYEPLTVAKSLIALGAVDQARAELERAAKDSWRASIVAGAQFRLEYQRGSPQEALAAYERLRDFGWSEDPLLQYRVALALRHPGLPFQWRDLAAIAALLALAAAVAVCALLVIAPVHYRGLARRLAGHQPHEYAGAWRLRDAWYAMFVLVFAEVLAFYCLPPVDLQLLTFWMPTLDDEAELARLQIAVLATSCLLALPLAVPAIRRGLVWRTHWTALKAVLVGAGIAVALRVPLILLMLAASDALTNAKSKWYGLQPQIPAMVEESGWGVALVAVGFVGPVIEEFMFRGVLLGAFSRHLSFVWANILQAALFAAFHVEPVMLPITFGLGLLAGVIARRSGGLLAPIVLHCIFNAISMLVFLL